MRLSSLLRSFVQGEETTNNRARPRVRLELEGLEERNVPSTLVPESTSYHGMSIVRGDARYDLQPAALYDPGDTLDANRNGIPDRLYKMWWLGRYSPGDPDKAPSTLHADDRIYVAFSENGVTWGRPQVALKGSSGLNGAINADDHLVGSPSVLKVGGKYYMFYEAMGNQVTPLNRFFSARRGDNWITNDLDLPVPNNAEGYAFERNLGFAPLLVKAGTHPVYSGEVLYTGGKYNRYLTTSPPFVGGRDGFTWTVRNGGFPVFWLYDQPGPGRKLISSFFDPVHSNTYATDNPNGDVPGSILVERLGYAAESLETPDTIGCLQNRVMMATSTDGVNWSRFQGPARGGAIISPQDEFTSRYNPTTWKIDQGYGAGYPSALVRDGYLELYFTDEDRATGPALDLRRVRLPLSRIEDPEAWRQARAAGNPSLTQFAGSGSDIKWSPTLQRYFVAYIRNHTPERDQNDPAFRQSATVLWSDVNPDPNLPPTFSPTVNEVVLPNGGRAGGWGGLLADGLGHVLTRPGDELHVYFSSHRPGVMPYPPPGPSVWDSDIAHASVRFVSASSGVGEVSGRVFADANRNGRRDSGEAALVGWVVYIDANLNGRLDPGETRTTTDSLGGYEFSLPPGTYRVRVVLRPGYGSVSGRTVTVTAGHTVTQHFGVLR